MEVDWLITPQNWTPSTFTCSQGDIYIYCSQVLCVIFQKHKEFVKTVKVEEIDGMKLVKNLAVKMEEVFQKKAEATRVSEIRLLFNLKWWIYPYLLGLIKELACSLKGHKKINSAKQKITSYIISL